ncbi:class B sortase, partial [Lachnospiraceae bacterium OttesenSCG-928-D06]|nr:class B sortase [Lachnospiraceae bacterium OttesenSCG-928-D06]
MEEIPTEHSTFKLGILERGAEAVKISGIIIKLIKMDKKVLKRQFMQMNPRLRYKLLGFVSFIAVCCFTFFFALTKLISIQIDRSASDREYEQLKNAYAVFYQRELEESDDFNGRQKEESEEAEIVPVLEYQNPIDVNEDYIGWIMIANTKIDYPVTLTEDNETYLTTSFSGRNSSYGTLFMDYENRAGFSSQHSIIYGHNIKNGAMFGSLSKYLSKEYQEQNEQIEVHTADGKCLIYSIINVEITDAWSSSYQVNFLNDKEFEAFAKSLGAPEGTERLLTLSTCTSSSDKDERLLIH